MQRLGEFDTNMRALESRLKAHERFGSSDLNTWIMKALEPMPGDNVLDLGCGTGKQSIPLAKLVGAEGLVTSVDISADALDAVTQKSALSGLDSRLSTLQSDLDEVPSKLAGATFQKILASYSLYYARDRVTILEFLYSILGPGGVLFFCGPAGSNNRELKDFHNSLKKIEGPAAATPAAVFLENEGPDTVRRLFGKCDVLTFNNPIRFSSATALYDYWSSYNLYDENLEDKFRHKAHSHFQKYDEFMTVKRVLGIRAVR